MAAISAEKIAFSLINSVTIDILDWLKWQNVGFHTLAIYWDRKLEIKTKKLMFKPEII